MALLAVMLVLFGLNIILLLPCSIIGVWLYGWVKAAPALSRASGLILTILPVVIYAGALSADVPEVLQQVTLGLISLDQLYSLRFSDEFIWNVFLAALTGLHLAGVQALCQTLQEQENALSKGVRDAAFVSFSLNLLHNPVLQFLKPMMSSVGWLPLPDLSLLVMTLLLCALFGAAFERTLRQQRALVLQLFAARPKRT